VDEPHFRFSARIPVKVQSTRRVTIGTNLLPHLNLAQGSSTLCEIRADVVGDPGIFSIAPEAIPEGVSLANGSQSLPVDGSVFVGLSINIDPHAPLSSAAQPLSIRWTVAGDNLHDPVTDTLSFKLHIVAPEPAELQFDAENLVFPNDMPVNGSAHLLLRRDGTYKFWGHFHNSGAVDVNYGVAIAIRDPQATAYTVAHPGKLAGSLTPGLGDDDWENELRDDRIAQNWVVLLEGSTQSVAWRARMDLANITAEAVGALGTVLAVVALVV